MSASRELQRQLKRRELCLPRPAKRPPAGSGWIHQIKHDGFRILAEREGKGVILHTRRGFNFADRSPLAVAAIAKLPVKSCLIDGERSCATRTAWRCSNCYGSVGLATP